MSDSRNKRKSKSWYRKQAFINKRQKTDGKPGHRLAPGLKGFIVTCNDHERDAVKESYNILNEYAEKLYGPEKKVDIADGGDIDDDEEDIEKAIAVQVQEMKDAGTKVDRRFQNCLTGAKNCIFIKTTIDDPAGLARAIFADLFRTKVQKCRYALRLLPVVGTCKATVKEIGDLAKVVLAPFFVENKFEVTYTINFKARNNNGIGREMTTSTLRNTITETFSSCLLRYSSVSPQITISVEVMCGVACIAVAKDFAHFRKYNLLEIVNEKQSPINAARPESRGSTQHPSADGGSASKADVGQLQTETATCQSDSDTPHEVHSVSDTKKSASSDIAEQVSSELQSSETDQNEIVEANSSADKNYSGIVKSSEDDEGKSDNTVIPQACDSDETMSEQAKVGKE